MKKHTPGSVVRYLIENPPKTRIVGFEETPGQGAGGYPVVEVLCSGPHPEGARQPDVGGLCAAHYMQQRREPTRPLRPLRSGVDAQVVFRCTAELKAAVENAAKAEGIEPAEWWRQAGLERLRR